MKETRTRSWALTAITIALMGMSSASAKEPPDLLHVMQQLGRNLTQISDGMLSEDYAAVAAAAAAIADHPKPPMVQRKTIMQGLGADVGQFQQGDRVVHDAALAVQGAAQREDDQQVLRYYVELVEGCMGCHTRFRKRVRGILAN